MALISARTIITSVSLFHITLAYFFLTNPVAIADQALVFLLGEAMGMPYASNFETQSPALAFLAVMLASIGVTDLVSLSLPEEVAMVHHWGTQAPLRMSISLLLVLYAFFFSGPSPFSSPSARRRALAEANFSAKSGLASSSWGGDGLKNSVFFTFIFVELISWFWVWVTLREEHRDLLRRRGNRRRSSQTSR